MLNRRLVLGLVAALFALTVLGGAQGAAAEPAAVSVEDLGLSFELTCTPDTFLPGEWVVVECVQHIANGGPATLSDIHLDIGGKSTGPIPAIFFMWTVRDGRYMPMGTGQINYLPPDLKPGESGESHTVLLLWMGDGTFETEAKVSVGGRLIVAQPIRFTATDGAAAPPSDLLVSRRLLAQPGQSETVYETTITNRSRSAVKELLVTERYDTSATFVGAEPPAKSELPEAQLSTWGLASFGKDSLKPGESLALRTTYGRPPDSECGIAVTAAVVEASVDGERQRYGVRGEDTTMGICVGGDSPGTVVPGGEGPGSTVGAVALPSGGEGPAGREVDVLWAVAVLVTGGASLVGAAMALRRRAR
jgi:hypothetical protein